MIQFAAACSGGAEWPGEAERKIYKNLVEKAIKTVDIYISTPSAAASALEQFVLEKRNPLKRE